MTKIKVFIDVKDKRWTEAVKNTATVVERVKDAVQARVENEVDFFVQPRKFQVNLCLSNDAAVHRLNLEFRGIDRPTNVLSFASVDDPAFVEMVKSEKDVELGDVIIAFETMQREAEEQGISLHDHFCHLWAHGLLHILGYDHIEPEDAAEMEWREIEILAKLGIDNPYQE